MESLPSKEELNEAFKKADEENSGKLTFSQMKELMQAFVTDDQKNDPNFNFNQMADMICNMADVNGDKMIDFGEILLLMFGDSLEPELP